MKTIENEEDEGEEGEEEEEEGRGNKVKPRNNKHHI